LEAPPAPPSLRRQPRYGPRRHLPSPEQFPDSGAEDEAVYVWEPAGREDGGRGNAVTAGNEGGRSARRWEWERSNGRRPSPFGLDDAEVGEGVPTAPSSRFGRWILFG
jgi:hypothetical protein